MLATLLLKRKLQHLGHKLVICGSHPDCFVSQWVNRCDPLSTLIYMYLAIHAYDIIIAIAIP